MDKLAYLIRRLIIAIPTFAGITVVCFALTRFLPGGPVDMRLMRMRGLSTDSATMLRTLGRHVRALHVHDNDCHRDSHELPYTMQMDFDSIARALADIDYQGDITLEACYYWKDATAEEQPTRLANMAAAARRLADAVEGYKKK